MHKAVGAVFKHDPESLLPANLKDKSKQIADLIYKSLSASLKPLKSYETVRVSTNPVQQPVTMLKLPKQLFCNVPEYKKEYDQMLADAKCMDVSYLQQDYDNKHIAAEEDDYNTMTMTMRTIVRFK